MSSGFLVVDKPAGITSHDVVSVLRRVFGIKRIGHTGTLDPFATGVLPMAIGHATRMIQFLDEGVKVYEARIQLGVSTDTGDLTGEVTARAAVPVIDAAGINRVLGTFLGAQMQTPPAYSAVKVKGRALYSYARAGERVVAAARPIRIDALTLVEQGADTLDLHIQCGRGTYVRVLAEEISEALGTKGHLVALRRTQSGPFDVGQSLDFETLSELVSGGSDWRAALRPPRGVERAPWRDRVAFLAEIQSRLMPPLAVLGHLPMVTLDTGELRLLQLKGVVAAVPENVSEGGHWCVLDGERLLGVMKRVGAVGRVARMLPPLDATPRSQVDDAPSGR
jgi:tRNA pseudouridine55 synthase